MKKRIVCVLLTLIMLMSLVPLSASAAGMSISESAITILKQLEGYTTKCNTNGYTGYGTKCTEKGTHGSHTTTEKLADKALRAALEDLDAAVNSFASKKGISLTQSKHDALVLFSFENGTAWTTGTGDLQAAVASGATGTEFLNAICRWDASTADDYRRMIEANMYLNGVYSSSRPSTFISVTYDPNGGSINNNTALQYYDLSSNTVPHLVPTKDNHTFTGWYISVGANNGTGTTQVTKLTSSHFGKTLIAGWVPTYSIPGFNAVNYVVKQSQLVSQTVYKYNESKGQFEAVAKESAKDYYILEEALYVDSDYLDESGARWCRILGTADAATSSDGRWVKVTGVGSTATYSGTEIDVTVTVTNSYVRSRANATIHSAQNGTYNQGDQLRIINTEDADGFLWGQVAASATDNTPVGWVALMYTNFESVRNGDSNSVNNSTAIATAVITYNGYVNVRSDAGTDNKIVSALPKGTEVSLYETKFVNGLEWGRCSTGWFCLSYASVNRLTTNTSYTSDVGFTSYVFTGKIDPNSVEIYDAPSASANRVYTRKVLDSKVTITNLTSADGYTWGKFSEGWVRVTNNSTYAPADVNLDTAKFLVSADSLTVRTSPNTAASRVDSLVKGVEFNVNVDNSGKQILVVGDSIWGWADKVGEDYRTYNGWVNLANKYVTRNGAPTVSTNDGSSATITGTMATVINTDSLKVRNTGATYGTQIGTLSRGTTVSVWEKNEDGWYKVDSNKNGTYDYEEDGWVSGSYLNVYEGTASSDSTSSGTASSGSTGTVETGMGVVANTYSGVNVRQGAGTGYAAVGKLLPGTAVEILEVTTAGASKWGRTAQGWVCMDYIAMISNYEVAGSTTGTSTGTGTAGTSTGATTDSESAIYTGTATGTVTVYKEASTKSDAVRTLNAGDPITLHELLTVVETTTDPVGSSNNNTNASSTTTTTKTTYYWARVNDGYICAPGDNIALDTVDEHTYTMTGSNTLNVRNAAGTSSTTVLDKLAKGDQVTITELQIVNGNVWGKAEYEGEEGELLTGWVSLKYMTKGAVTIADETQNDTTNNTNTTTGTTTGTTNNVVMGNGSSTGGFVTNTSGYRYTGKVIRTNELNVRASASTTASKTTTLTNGQALVIYETTVAENMAWGRCDAGWVYLYYVDLTPVTGAVDARVVYNDNTIIYSDMNGSAVAGTYSRMSVVDIYEIVGKMARTELGWVNTDNLL